jgi:hypothetical protein
MDSTDKSLVLSIGMLFGFLTVMIALFTYGDHLKQSAIVEMVSKGADPIAARCAIDGKNCGCAAVKTN